MITVFDALAAYDLPHGAVATIGNFDGVHRGHQAIVAAAVARGKELGAPSAVITFDPHPAVVLRPAGAPVPLQTLEQRLRTLAAAGPDYALVVRFNRQVSLMPAEEFVSEFLVHRLAVAELHIGHGFSFGRDRAGSVALLEELGAAAGFRVVAAPEELHDGVPISSSRIRAALAEGTVTEVTAMLGRPFSIEGTIARGERMGSRLGFPTLNFKTENALLPKGGVYVSRVRFASLPQWFPSVTNIGVRPTLYENYRQMVESHVIDFSMDVYGERTTLEFFARLRDEQRFSSTVDLTTQIRADIIAARDHFAALAR